MWSMGARADANAGWRALDGSANALNAVRLVLASVVVLAHSWQLVHGSLWQHMPYASSFAVDSFFVLSGYLVAGSRAKLPMGRFLLRRALRILPGLWVVLAFTAFALAPLVAAARGVAFDWSSARDYVTGNAVFAIHQQHDIANLLAGVPVHIWNGSLWTLGWEAMAYLLAALLLWRPALRRAGSWTLLVALTAWLLTQHETALGSREGVARAMTLFAFFAAGLVLRFELYRLPCAGRLATAAGGLVAMAFVLDSPTAYTLAGPLGVGYALLWVSARAPLRTGSRNDISYGIYIYGSPLQQAAIALGFASYLGPIAFAVLSLVVVAPFAWGSWVMVERPAIRFARGVRSAGSDQPDYVPARPLEELHREWVPAERADSTHDESESAGLPHLGK